MAELEISNRKQNKKAHLSTRVDLTPMVDLGFLLITFFMFTTTLSTPTAMKLVMPDDSCDTCKTMVPNWAGLTILPENVDRAAFYEGPLNEQTQIHWIDLKNAKALRELIINKQKSIRAIGKPENSLVVVIKPSNTSTYDNLVNVLDEMKINNVTKYAITDRLPDENKLVISL